MMLAIEVTAVPEHPEPTVTETVKIGLTAEEIEQVLTDRLSERLQLSLREGIYEMVRSVTREAEQQHERYAGGSR